MLSGHSDFVETVAFSHDGSHVACGLRDHTVRIWNATGKPVCILEGHQDWVTFVTPSHTMTVVLSPDLMAAPSGSGT